MSNRPKYIGLKHGPQRDRCPYCWAFKVHDKGGVTVYDCGTEKHPVLGVERSETCRELCEKSTSRSETG